MLLENQSSSLLKIIVNISAVIPNFLWASGCFSFVLIFFFPHALLAFEESYESAVASAAESGDSQAQYALALLYEYGTDTIVRDPEQSIFWLRKSAKDGIAGACLYLGLKYEYGNRVKKDLGKAARCYACAAHKDWPAAQFFLAAMYEKGKGVPQSSLKAMAWLGLAVDHGYPGAEKEFSRLLSLTGYKDMKELKRIQKHLLLNEVQICD